ncbi:hypothetical protein HNO88_000290 [Novosphingobium chloroacetimidivorans]|uniref:Uncharacterized protein n=1 Tax=Novosphingobium chloroacetimidivorans TaxID=1428314 RepID=A0A7W7K7E9_9SPHN|nr:hypothetical protein [Novosphingobium chloroacetimidivorans]MBB4856993.1 hypothetical protein [Novosphingobium chloroacetimidivorans]
MIDVHHNSEAMARVLVQYIADPFKVRRLVKAEFQRAPNIDTIKALRARFERPAPAPINHTWEIDLHSERMKAANAAFLNAIERAGRQVVRP